MLSRNISYTLFSLALFFCSFMQTFAQVEEDLKVFIDCRTNCDLTFFKQKLDYVDHVRDIALADVQILLSRYPTANGGSNYELEFIGYKQCEGQDSKLFQNTLPNATADEIRKALLKRIELGLVPYIMDSPLADFITVKVKKPAEKKGDNALDIEDPWKFWVFEIRMDGNANLESARRTVRWSARVDMDHVTEKWRINQTPYYNINTKTFVNDEEPDITSRLQRYGLYGRIVRSIDEHWSVGIFDGYSSSTFNNIKSGWRIGPALEYSVFPYKDVTSRELTIAYYNRFYRRDYFEETIFGKLEESLWDEAIRVSLRLRKPWGSFFSSLEGRHFFHDFSKNSIEFNNRASVRVIKGLNFNMTANFEFVNDQLYLPRGEASLEDVLLQQASLATNFELYVAMGVSYTFGSIFNNVINTRL